MGMSTLNLLLSQISNMKFAHEFKEALQREGFPPHWVESAIPYGQLKKCIKKVEGELRSLGLDSRTLGLLIPPSPEQHNSADDAPPVAFKYRFAEDFDAFRPTLTLYIQRNEENGVAIDATLSPNTRKYLKDLASRPLSGHHLLSSSEDLAAETKSECILDTPHAISDIETRASRLSDCLGSEVQRIEVPLTFDSEFFGLLKNDVSSLGAIQEAEQRAMTDEIRALGKEIAKLAVPAKSNKTDLGRWRNIFDLYLQAGVFFSTNELDHGSRTSSVALRQLQWFQAQVTKLDLPMSFKLVRSREALDRFTRINMVLLRNLKFQEINQLAISKILKKFDKRTSLGAKQTFPSLIESDPIMSETMAKAVCAGVSNEIIKIVPQLDDYLCPVCFGISYRPVRLSCSHVFCIRCMIEMQKSNSKYCPLCRGDVVMTADSTNVDKALMAFLKKYFPNETKAKQHENEIAAGIDMYGEDFANVKCTIM